MNCRIRSSAGAWTAVAILLAVASLAGCREPEPTRSSSPRTESAAAAPDAKANEAAGAALDDRLAGTDWHLVEFQSMDDATGTLRPDDPSLYTMRLNADGTVAMRLNCNRATGTWSAEPAGDGSSGHFVFGPLAATRAMCPPPSMDEHIVAQSAFVRSYLLKENKLYLSLMADGGIYAWERHVE